MEKYLVWISGDRVLLISSYTGLNNVHSNLFLLLNVDVVCKRAFGKSIGIS